MAFTKEQKIIKQLSGAVIQKRVPIATEMFLPNHSGDHSAGHTSTPVNDLDLVNKKYVDDKTFTSLTDPYVIVIDGQSNAVGVGTTGMQTTIPDNTYIVDATTPLTQLTAFAQVPLNPTGAANIAVSAAREIRNSKLIPDDFRIIIIFNGHSGDSIIKWTGKRKNSEYYLELVSAFTNAGVTKANLFIRSQGEADSTTSPRGLFSFTIEDGGLNYAVDDILTIVGGTSVTEAAQIKVTAVDGSGTITAAEVYNCGEYLYFPDDPATVSGGLGTGATFNLEGYNTNDNFKVALDNYFSDLEDDGYVDGTTVIGYTEMGLWPNQTAHARNESIYSWVSDKPAQRFLLSAVGLEQEEGYVNLNHYNGAGIDILGLEAASSLKSVYCGTGVDIINYKSERGYAASNMPNYSLVLETKRFGSDEVRSGFAIDSRAAIIDLPRVGDIGGYVSGVIYVWSETGGKTRLSTLQQIITPLGTSSDKHVIDLFIVNGGTDYTVDDVLTIGGGTYTTQATIKVNSVDGDGKILTASIVDNGQYSVSPTNPVSVTGGTGNDDATFTLINSYYVELGNGVYDVVCIRDRWHYFNRLPIQGGVVFNSPVNFTAEEEITLSDEQLQMSLFNCFSNTVNLPSNTPLQGRLFTFIARSITTQDILIQIDGGATGKFQLPAQVGVAAGLNEDWIVDNYTLDTYGQVVTFLGIAGKYFVISDSKWAIQGDTSSSKTLTPSGTSGIGGVAQSVIDLTDCFNTTVSVDGAGEVLLPNPNLLEGKGKLRVLNVSGGNITITTDAGSIYTSSGVITSASSFTLSNNSMAELTPAANNYWILDVIGGSSSIVGLSGTKAQFDTACSDGNFAYSGGAFHDGFSDFVANEHIDWTNAASNFKTAGSVTTGSLTGNVISSLGVLQNGSVNGASEISGIIPIANGGTGNSTFTDDKLIMGNGSSALTSTDFNATNNILTMPSQPAFRAYASGSVSVATATYTILAFNQESYDQGSNYNTTTYRFTAPTAGLYAIGCKLWFTSAAWPAGALTQIRVDVNGATVSLGYRDTTEANTTHIKAIHSHDVLSLAANDYVELYAYQSTGGTLNLYGNNTYCYSYGYKVA